LPGDSLQLQTYQPIGDVVRTAAPNVVIAVPNYGFNPFHFALFIGLFDAGDEPSSGQIAGLLSCIQHLVNYLMASRLHACGEDSIKEKKMMRILSNKMFAIFLLGLLSAQAHAEGRWGAIKDSRSLQDIQNVIHGPAIPDPTELRVVDLFNKAAEDVIEAFESCKAGSNVSKEGRDDSLFGALTLLDQVGMVSHSDPNAMAMAAVLSAEVKVMISENRDDTFCRKH
jgi:hypothetical protein